MLTIVGVVPDGNQELRTSLRFCTWLEGTQVFEPSSTASQGIEQESGLKGEVGLYPIVIY